MSLILALETSTHLCGAALLEDDVPLVDLALQRPRIHAERLTVLVEQALDHADRSLAELDAVAVSEGPGSYTGLRIGASTAKGLVEGCDCALVGVPSLEAVAASMRAHAEADDLVLVLRHARASEYFAAGYRVREHGSERFPEAALPVRVLEEGEIPEAFEVAGRGTRWLAGARQDWPHSLLGTIDGRASFLPSGRTAPAASWTARLAARRLREGDLQEVDRWEPAYGRPFRTHTRRPVFDRLSEDS